jgi:hypothetical protein
MSISKTNGHAKAMEWNLDMPSQRELEQESLRDHRFALESQRVLTKEEQRVADEGNKQLLAFKFELMKGRVVLEGNAELHELSGTHFYETAAHHHELVQAAATTAYENVVKQFTGYDLTSLARQNQKLNELYYHKLADESMRPVYQEREPEPTVVERTVIKEVPQPGAFKKLFG